MRQARFATTAVILAACGVGVVSVGINSAWSQATQPAGEVASEIVAAPAAATVRPATQPSTQPATQPVEPKALTEHVNKGLRWLAQRQLNDGGWGQGDESAHMGSGTEQLAGSANVADTCMAALALMRAGNTPTAGEYATNVRRGIDYVCGQVEKSDDVSLYVTDVKGTRVQGKLGTYVDTFTAALLLAEAKDRMGDDAANKRVLAALDKTMDKIERNQQKDGGWANEGWAPALAQGLASKSINRAAQNGASVEEDVRKRAEMYARDNFDLAGGQVKATGSAGVPLYAVASNVQSLKDSDDTNQLRKQELQRQLGAPTTQPEQRAAAERELSDINENEKVLAAATQAVVARMDDKQFVAGFGSNGGEEFLSYMNIGEALVARGGAEWGKWDASMTGNLNRIQNDDGSWSGHHCITGKTFCTSAALMVLTVDRTTTPVAGQIKKG
jgi:hypothetical protein